MQALSDVRLPNADFEFICDEGPSFPWVVVGLSFHEAVNAHYEANVELECEADDPELDGFLGASGELVFLRAAESRRVYGVVAEAEHLGSTVGHQRIRLVLVPALSLVDEGSNSRIFQGAPVQQIVREVLEPALDEYGRKLVLDQTSRGMATRDYCVQYRESDCDFATRLLEEEGVSYVFEHPEGEGAELLVLRDANEQYLEYQGLDGSNQVPVIVDKGEQAELEAIHELSSSGALRLSAVARRDYDWLSPSDLLTQSTGGADAGGRTRRRYLHGHRRFIADDQSERVGDQLEAERVDTLVLRGRSNVTAFQAGMRFCLVAPTNPELEGDYLLTEVVHDARQGFASGESQTYSNEFECVPLSEPLRPRPIHPRPRVHGPQTATVVGDEEIHTDEHGRIQVQFHWEEKPSYAADASCWVRCAQSWSGPGWGAQFIPRVGMEVVVEFLEGNPDCPLVMGCVYNGDNPVPFALPDDKTQSGWRTNSSPDSEGYNMLRFEDAAGNEEIHIHGQKDWTIVIENDKVEEILHDQSLDVSNDRTKHIGNDETSTIDHDRSVTVANNHDETVGVNQNVTIGSNQLVTIGANATEAVGAVKSVTVGAAYALTVGAAFSVGVSGGASESVGGSKTVTVDGSASESVAESKTVTVKSLEENVETDKKVTAGELLRMCAGKDFGLEAKKKGLVDAGDKLVLSCGKASITLEKSGNIKIEGKEITVKGKGNVKIKGKKIALN